MKFAKISPFIAGAILASQGLTAQSVPAQSGKSLDAIVGESKESEVTVANKLLRNFPTTIPGAEKVEKYEVPGAKYTLVHIRQVHETPTMSDIYVPEVQEVQDNIYEIVRYLAQHEGVKEVLDEGFTRENQELDELKKLNEEMKNIVNSLPEPPSFETLEFDVHKDQDGLIVLQRSCIDKPKDAPVVNRNNPVTEHENTTPLGYRPGRKIIEGVWRANDEGLIKMIGGETLEGNICGFLALYRPGGTNNSVTLDDREDIVLDTMRSKYHEGSLAVVCFGGAHDFGGKETKGASYIGIGRKSFRDNLYEMKEQGIPISLIEIVPQGYDKK
jgi:hypothetical protein